ncbi:MAG: ABC transporter ATP-binding protein [Mycoplasmataceae bacterium]|nr:ABC transporter ATP-binding protein [Mycoplasmataceae bacterium]
MSKAIIELKNVTKTFDNKVILNNINLKINEGEFITLLGPSGSGKTTIIRLIGGFEWATRGEIKFNDADIKDLPAYLRDTSTIFQDYALFPHLSVENNIKYGLRLKRFPKPAADIKENMKKVLKIKIKQWEKKANLEMKKLDKIQQGFEDLKTNKITKRQRDKIQNWLDDSDFKYSYWETFTKQSINKFNKRYMLRKITKDELNSKVSEALSLVELEGHEKKSIDKLSGGQKQRVALARAIAVEPKILLLDEPLSSLDAKIREKMQILLSDLQKQLNITFIFVTHDREEALQLSDRIAIIRNGGIEQFDTPKEIYDYPKNKWVAQFIGDYNIFEGEIIDDSTVMFLGKKNKFWKQKYSFEKGEKVDVLIRPEDIQIRKNDGITSGKVISSSYKGSYYLTIVKNKKSEFIVESTNDYKEGEKVYLDWTITAMHLMLQEKENLEEQNEIF